MGNLIVKDNALVEASHKLSETEQRLILLAILKAREFCHSIEELKDKELIIYADDYMETFKTKRQPTYAILKKAVMELYRAEWGYKYLNNKGNVVVAYERFIQSAKYIEKEGSVKFVFANAIIPLLVELEKNFTKYEIKQVANLSSRYSMRLYECLMQFKHSGVFQISLADLRFRLGLLPDEYALMSNFKSRVLDFSVKEINQHTDVDVAYEQQKQGRAIVGFVFKFKYKTNIVPPSPELLDNQHLDEVPFIDVFSQFSKKEQSIIQKKIDDYIQHLQNKGETVDDFYRQNITNKAIAEQWGLTEYHQKEQQRERKKAEQTQQKQQALSKNHEKKQVKKYHQALIQFFEQLPVAEQAEIIDELEQQISQNETLKQLFKKAKQEGEVHKAGMFQETFKSIMENKFGETLKNAIQAA